MRAIVVGAVESSRVAIQAIGRAAGWSLPLVITLPLDLARRHSDFVDLRDAAREAGAEVMAAAEVNAPEVREAIKAVAPDYLFVVGWSQICRPPLISAPLRGTIGYHPAPLPRMRGRAVIPWTILEREPITGATLFWMDEGVDSGPILEQRFMHVAPDETATTLYRRQMELLERMMADALAALAAGTPAREPQDERFATWAARRTPESGRIDWRDRASDIERLVRAVTRPYPGARTRLPGQDQDLIVWQARIVDDGSRHHAREGQIVARTDTSLTVRCGHGTALEITEWECPETAKLTLHAQFGVHP